MKKRTRIFLAALGVSFLSGCSANVQWVNKPYYGYMDTTFTFRHLGASDEIVSHIDALLKQYHNEANTVAVAGLANVYTLNQTNEPVQVDDTLYDLLKFSLEMENKTQGYFNPLLGSLTALWKDHLFPNTLSDGTLPEGSLPSASDISTALSDAKTSALLLLPDNKIQRVGKGQIDLGGIAKGYACQKVKEYLASLSFTNFFFNGGNSSMVLGEKGNASTPWNVGFVDLGDSYYLPVIDQVLGSSSVMEQLAEIPRGSGKFYSHIINPFTGSAAVDWYGMTSVGSDAGILDALTTVFVLLGPDDPLTSALESDYGLKSLYYKLNVSVVYDAKGNPTYTSSVASLVKHGLEPLS
jgi:thiamine biosynthesis lipoprotein